MGYKDILKLQEISGANAKQEFLESHKDDAFFKTFLYYAENPMITYNVSEKTLRKLVNLYDPSTEHGKRPHSFDNIFDCCDTLSHLRGMDTATLYKIQTFLCEECKDEEERELYIKLLSKTLRLGVTAKTINKVMENLIPEWEVQQAFPFEKYPIPNDQEFWLTQKLNGVRATYYNGQLISRSGQPYTGLEHILKEIRYASERGIVLDGELTLLDRGELSDNEAFRMATGIINSDSEDKTAICYTVFDAIGVYDFDDNRSNVPYKFRRAIMDKLDKEMCADAKYVSILPVLYYGRDQKVIWSMLDKMVNEDKEGLMLNTNAPYRRTRHKGILKIKKFYTMDLPIVRCVRGRGRLHDGLGSFVVDYMGNEVNVGSGFTDEQRFAFWQMRERLVGKLCEVKFKETSYDLKTGNQSLQFPIFVSLRTDKTEVSYG